MRTRTHIYVKNNAYTYKHENNNKNPQFDF